MRTALALVAGAAALLAGFALAAPAATTAALVFSDSAGNVYASGLKAASPSTVYETDGSTTLQPLALTPDGKRILALESGDADQLVFLPVAGGATTAIRGTTGAGSASLSPDGKSVVFATDAGIYTVSAAGGTAKRVLATPADAADSLPQLAPGGKQIAFARVETNADGDETTTLELVAATGGTVKDLTTGPLAAAASGGRISFSPDGKTIIYAGGDEPGIFAVAAAGGTLRQLTTDLDYWPSFTADGSAIVFARDAYSDNSDGNSNEFQDDDVYELWTMSPSGAGETVVSQGDFENLALVPPVRAGSAATTTTTTTTTTPSGVPVSAASITLREAGSRYAVSWTGTASAWKVTLRVGKTVATATLKGSVHRHTFTLPKAKGAVSVTVTGFE